MNQQEYEKNKEKKEGDFVTQEGYEKSKKQTSEYELYSSQIKHFESVIELIKNGETKDLKFIYSLNLYSKDLFGKNFPKDLRPEFIELFVKFLEDIITKFKENRDLI